MGASTTEVQSRNVPTLSKPSVVIDMIRSAAAAVQASASAPEQPERGPSSGP
jgi:hypothetical protein